MVNPAQLDRIAAAVGTGPATKIYKLHKGIDVWFWLCEPCLGEKLAKGWAKLETRQPPHKLDCEECRFRRGEMRT